MKIFEMAAVIDCGKYYEVEYLTSSYNKDFETNKKFLGLSVFAAKEIKKALAENKIVRIVSDYSNIDVQPHDLMIVEPNIDDIEQLKMVYLKKARQMVTHQQANVSGLMMYQFININNILCDKGYFIHDDNKEEVYLQILETGDEKLIDKLEEFLNARDIIDRSSFLEEKYYTFFNDMKNSDTNEEVEKHYETFMKYFQNVT